MENKAEKETNYVFPRLSTEKVEKQSKFPEDDPGD